MSKLVGGGEWSNPLCPLSQITTQHITPCVSQKQWELLIFTELSDVLALELLDVTLTLSQIYQHVTWNE